MISMSEARRSLLRVDINQPVNKDTEELEDITRIKGCAPTVKELSDKGATSGDSGASGQRHRVQELP